jgi:hypothetical protein
MTLAINKFHSEPTILFLSAAFNSTSSLSAGST